MLMTPFVRRTPSDDDAFASRVDAACRGVQRFYRPAKLRLVHVDNWFGPRWLGFSGKVLGLAGMNKGTENPTPPPFVPSRIVPEQLWSRDAEGCYRPAPITSDLHVAQDGEANTRRHLAEIAPNVALLWFSANTVTNQRGAIMAYIPSGDFYLGWYVGLGADIDWGVSETKQTSRDEFERFLSLGGA